MSLLSIGELKQMSAAQQKEYVSYRKEVGVIKEYIRQVFSWYLKNKGEKELKLALSSIKHGAVKESAENIESTAFPTLVETTLFFTAVKKQKAGEKVEFTYAWGDQPRVTFFRVAWRELGLPEYPVSPFHLMYTKKELASNL